MTTTEDDLIRHVEVFCAVLNVYMPKQKLNQRCSGYAFVQVENLETAQNLTNQIHVIKGRNIECQVAIHKKEKSFYREDLSQRKVFIAGMKAYVSISSIRMELLQFGALKNCYRIGSSHANRGLAFAEFFSSKAAAEVVRSGLVVSGCQLRVSFFRPKPCTGEQYDSNQFGYQVETPTEQVDYDSNLPENHYIQPMNDSDQINFSINHRQMEPKYATESAQIESQRFGQDENYQFRIIRREGSDMVKTIVQGSVIYLRQSQINKIQGRQNKSPINKPSNQTENQAKKCGIFQPGISSKARLLTESRNEHVLQNKPDIQIKRRIPQGMLSDQFHEYADKSVYDHFKM